MKLRKWLHQWDMCCSKGSVSSVRTGKDLIYNTKPTKKGKKGRELVEAILESLVARFRIHPSRHATPEGLGISLALLS